MNITLKPASESALRALAKRAGVTPERYAADALAAHLREYDRWFVASVEKGLKDVAEGRVLTPQQSKQRDESRRARLSGKKR